jgi:hypothetical protein
VQKGVNKDAYWVLDFLESREYHDHAHHMKGVSHRVCQIPIDVYSRPTANQGEFSVGVVHKLDGH